VILKSVVFQNSIKLLYGYVCKIYSFFVTIYENIFYKKSNNKYYIVRNGYFSKDINKYDLQNFESLNKQKINNYLNVYYLDKPNIDKLINSIFDLEFRNYISSVTGFNYSIDYLIMYERKFIEKKERDKNTLEQWYSYKWHFDKPNSKNTLKIIYPLNISSEHGPLTLIDIKSSKSIKNISKLNTKTKNFKFIGEGSKIYGFLPSRCIHKDGIPNKGKKSIQIMFQLNPHKRWSINLNLHKRNPDLNNKLKIWTNEPKFSFLTCFNDKRKYF
tara:strand:- start:429 stop:1244 length:816 start_codon:yes stop_codon:yes gene_type:complete